MFKKLELELALPPGLGKLNGLPSFAKIDGLLARSIELIENKLRLSFQIQGGIMRPILGSRKTHINDRFFVANSLGYHYLGHEFYPNAPPDPEHLKCSDKNYEKKIIGDDLGS